MYRTRTGYRCAAFAGRKLRQASFFATVLLGIVVAGCVPNQTNSNAPVANSAANSPANTNTNQAQPSAPETASSSAPITLPVVDALLSDEAFLTEVKRSVQPSEIGRASCRDRV